MDMLTAIGLLVLGALLVGLPAAIIQGRRNLQRQQREYTNFTAIASGLELVPSSVSNNPDYAFFYDAFTLSHDNPIWQTQSEPRIYLNPNRDHGAELFVKGNYELPLIKLEAKQNHTRVQHRWGNEVVMQAIQLEGNFNTYFDLYCEAGQAVVALQIISPNIMQQMIDEQQFYDVQIHGAAIMLTTDAQQWDTLFAKKLLSHAATLSGLVRATQKVTVPLV